MSQSKSSLAPSFFSYYLNLIYTYINEYSDAIFDEFIFVPEANDVEMSIGLQSHPDHSPNTLSIPETQESQYSIITPATTLFTPSECPTELGEQLTMYQVQFVSESGNAPTRNLNRHRSHQSNAGQRTSKDPACISCKKDKKRCTGRPRCWRCTKGGKKCVFNQDQSQTFPAASNLEGVNTPVSSSDYPQAPAPATFPDPNSLRVNMDFLQDILRSEEGSRILAYYRTPHWIQMESELDGRGMSDFDAAIRQGCTTTDVEFACPQDSPSVFNSSIPETNPANAIRSALREILRSKAWSDITKSVNTSGSNYRQGGSLVPNETEALTEIISALYEYSLTEDWVNVEDEPDLQRVAEFDTMISRGQNPTSMLYRDGSKDGSNPSHHRQQPNVKACSRPSAEDCSTLDKVGSAVIDAINIAVVGLCRVREILIAYERRR